MLVVLLWSLEMSAVFFSQGGKLPASKQGNLSLTLLSEWAK